MSFITNFFSFLLLLQISVSAQTASQIKQAKKMIKDSGMTNTEIRTLAKEKGLTDKQINKVIDSKPSLEKNIPELKSSNEPSLDLEAPELVEDTKEDMSNNLIEIKNQDSFSENNFFGYNIFQGNPDLFQSSSVGAVSPDYLVGPGDEIIVMLWGETQFRQVLKVDRGGFIFIPEVGQVFVNGLNLSLLESKLFKVLSQSYASLDPAGRKATTFLDISLGNLRPLRIQVIGQVKQPGAYTVNPSATLFSSLYYFNGPSPSGSLRDIRLIRNNKEISSIDFYNLLLTGKKLKDVKLQLDDVIFIPTRKKTVSILGEVSRPGIYELLEDESLNDLVRIANGLKITAYLGRAQIDRIIPFEDRETVGVDRMIKDILIAPDKASLDSIKLYDGDKITIFSIMDMRQNMVSITGAVSRPGNYEIKSSSKVRDLIIKSDSLLGNTYLEKLEITRINPDMTEKLININLAKAMDDDPQHNILLNNLDKIKVFNKTEMISRNFITIQGHVKNPGRYLLKEDMRLYDLLFVGGGFIDKEFLKLASPNGFLSRFDKGKNTREVISFNILSILGDSKVEENYLLLPDDIIRIFSKEELSNEKTILIGGEIKNPGSYDFQNNMTLTDLIMISGGFSESNKEYRVEVSRGSNNKEKEELETIIFTIDNSMKIKAPSFENFEGGDFKLMPFDFVQIRKEIDNKIKDIVTVEGAVRFPGVYAIENKNQKLYDIVRRAGGVKSNALLEGSEFFRDGQKINIDLKRVLKKPNSREDILVNDGDKIIIHEVKNTIQIIGEVNVPGNYKYQRNYRIKHYIKNAGGFTNNANKKDIYIKYPSGRSRKFRRWINNPKIEDTSIIVIGKKEDQEPLDINEFMTDFTTIIANLSQALAIFIIAKG